MMSLFQMEDRVQCNSKGEKQFLKEIPKNKSDNMFPYHFWVMIWICKPAILLLRLKVPTGGRILFNIVTTFAHFWGEIN